MFRPFTTWRYLSASLVISSALLLISCASLPQGIMVPGAGRYPLLPSAVFADTVSVTQSVTISGDNPQQFLLQTEVRPAGLSMVGLAGFGQKLFELQYERDTLAVNKTPFLPDSLVPEQLFADFQLIYWPVRLLRDTFANSAVEFTETTDERGQRRLFKLADGPGIEILYDSSLGIKSDLIYRNLRQGYAIRIKVLSTATP